MQTLITVPQRPAFIEPVVLQGLDIEAIRVPAERVFASLVDQHPRAQWIRSRVVPADVSEIRRRLMAQTLRLSDTMAPDAYRTARQAMAILSVGGEIELYQRSGAENAAIHLVEQPILIEIQGSMLALLDEPGLLGVIGHELGHYLAHGPRSPLRDALSVRSALGAMEMDAELEAAVSRLSMLAELTADRVGLLACQDLHAMLRLEMVTLTGLSSGALNWDTDAYLAQSRDLMEAALADGSGIYGGSHPEHNLRSYALWLFSETKEFRKLTGRGPGTRTLRDVDESLARFFGQDPAAAGRVVYDYSRSGEPPRELHECALAACVIVAHADGEFADEELAAIEKVFGPLVGDWRSYLDLEVAIERFHETATVLAASGTDLLRSLFSLLVHVMGADGIVDVREVEMILAIGRVLGMEAEYRRWLTSALWSLRVEVSVEETTPADLPLPPRRGDVASAFEAFLQCVRRRGETTITFRRLLRLLGHESRNDDLATQIAAKLRASGIELDADLRTVPLDESLLLVVPEAFRERGQPRSSEVPASRAALASALKRMREQLVSGDGRSPSVRLRKTRTGRSFDLMALDRVSVGLAERALAQIRAGKVARLVDASEAGRHSEASKAASELLALAREDALRVEETGAHDLFVGHPFLTGAIGGYLVRGPLVLYPVELERDGAGARGYRLKPRREEAPVTNQSLLRLLFAKKGFAFSDQLADELDQIAGDPDQGADAVLRKLADVGLAAAARPGTLGPLKDRDAELLERAEFLEVEEAAVLGLFPQSSSDLLQDYDGLLSEVANPTVEVGTLLGAATLLLADELVTRRAALAAPAEAPSAGHPVVLADPSQRSVVAECRKHDGTVVDGPPGTGKSQVIVNLVADALRRGETVAVVCEKRAALDVVVHRLEQIGLRHAIAVVHDVHEDRKSLYEQIAERLDVMELGAFDAARAEELTREQRSWARSLETRAALLAERPTGLELSLGELLTLASDAREVLQAAHGLERLSAAQLRELVEQALRCKPLARFWKRGSYWETASATAARGSLAGATPEGLRAIEADLEKALQRAQEVEALERETRVSAEAIESARGALALAHGSLQHRDAGGLFHALLAAGAERPDAFASVDAAKAALEEAGPSLARVGHRVGMDASPALASSLSVLSRWAGRLLRFFVLGWWLAKSTFRRELTRAWPERAGEAITPALLSDVGDRLAASRAWSVISAAFDRLSLGPWMSGSAETIGRTVESLASMAPAVRDLGLARPALASIDAWPQESGPDALSLWDRTIAERLRFIGARDAVRQAAARVAARFPWLGETPRSTVLQELLERFRQDSFGLAELDALLDRGRTLLPAFEPLLLALDDGYPDADASRWRNVLTASWARAWVDKLDRDSSIVARLGTGADDREVTRAGSRLVELEVELRELQIEHVLDRVNESKLLQTEAAEKHARRTALQKVREEMLRETRKKRRLMALRSFVRKFAPEGLLGVVPVWLLSPETMAILFPRQSLFDLVVFDEASQCTVESGLPVLIRAKRTVIAGDEKQMPPSSYFTLRSGDDEEEPATETTPTSASIRGMLSAESLLTLARTRMAHAGLEWHYRCLDESLIAFSNHAMYHGDLRTIPSVAGSAARSSLRWVSVPDGRYEGGANAPEAEVVVDTVADLLRRPAVPSIGIVTFNLKQRQTVLDALDRRLAHDSDFAERWSAQQAIAEPPFVKSLEFVQGDERDVILFSLGHAPKERTRRGGQTIERYVPARFGPLGLRGGERRLNVAISRAKTECVVVASFEPAQLDVAGSRHEGPRLLKQFLEFAHHMHHGHRHEADRVLDLVRAARLSQQRRRPRPAVEGLVPLAVQIGLELEKHQIPHELDVGASTFRIPVGVLHPTDPTRFALAILTDEEAGHPDAYDLHAHRPGVLRQRGWKVLRVTPATWYRRRSEVIEEIEALVPGARGAARSDLYVSHREARARRPAAPLPTAPLRPAVSAQAVIDAAPETAPEWSLAIEDVRYRRALIKIGGGAALGETELINIVGGPRRARLFAIELEVWRDLLPFHVEVDDTSGTRVFRNAGPRGDS